MGGVPVSGNTQGVPGHGGAPAKPPRGSQSSEGGRTLWQIFWNEEEEEPVVSMVDISHIDDEQEIDTGLLMWEGALEGNRK